MSQNYKVQQLTLGMYSLKKYDRNIGEYVAISEHATYGYALAAIPDYVPEVPSAKMLELRTRMRAEAVRARAAFALE